METRLYSGGLWGKRLFGLQGIFFVAIPQVATVTGGAYPVPNTFMASSLCFSLSHIHMHAHTHTHTHTNKPTLLLVTMVERTKCSKVWLHFTRVDVDNARCHKCNKSLAGRKLKQSFETASKSASHTVKLYSMTKISYPDTHQFISR